MATKKKPGEYDCYAKAADDEPMFILLARDPLAPVLVEAWAVLRERMQGATAAQIAEARDCALQMILWRRENR